MYKVLFDEIVNWQDKTFLKATPLSCVNHLQEEVKELKESIEAGNPDTKEVADCFLLLIGVCNKIGLSHYDINRIITDKMIENYNRTWGEVNEQGYVKHV